MSCMTLVRTTFALLLVLGAAGPAAAQDAEEPAPQEVWFGDDIAVTYEARIEDAEDALRNRLAAFGDWFQRSMDIECSGRVSVVRLVEIMAPGRHRPRQMNWVMALDFDADGFVEPGEVGAGLWQSLQHQVERRMHGDVDGDGVLGPREYALFVPDPGAETNEERVSELQVGRRADHVDLRDLRHRGELVAHPLGERLQREDVGGPGDGDVGDPAAGDHLPDDGLLGLDGKRRDGVDVVLDLVHHPARIGAELELDHDRGAALGCGGLDLLDAVDALNRLLDADDDPFLDLFRRRAEVRHLDADPVELELRHHLFANRGRGDEAAHDDEDSMTWSLARACSASHASSPSSCRTHSSPTQPETPTRSQSSPGSFRRSAASAIARAASAAAMVARRRQRPNPSPAMSHPSCSGSQSRSP